MTHVTVHSTFSQQPCDWTDWVSVANCCKWCKHCKQVCFCFGTLYSVPCVLYGVEDRGCICWRSCLLCSCYKIVLLVPHSDILVVSTFSCDATLKTGTLLAQTKHSILNWSTRNVLPMALWIIIHCRGSTTLLNATGIIRILCTPRCN